MRVQRAYAADSETATKKAMNDIIRNTIPSCLILLGVQFFSINPLLAETDEA